MKLELDQGSATVPRKKGSNSLKIFVGNNSS